MPRVAKRMRRIVGSATVGIGDLVARKRAEGVDVVGLSMGEPDFPTPQHVIDAAKAALDAGHTKYTPGAGIPALRQAISETEARDNGIPCRPEHVIVSPAKQAVMMAVLATAQHGDEVLLPDPGWVSYEPIIQWAHATPKPVPLDPTFRMTPEAVAESITDKSRLIILNSPSNPTGGINTQGDIRGIMELAEDHDLWVLSDELYQKLIYDGEHLSPASLPGAFERTLTVNGLSKAYAMTGWRLGWAVAEPKILAEINKLQSHSVTHCTSFAQYGGVAALTGPQDTVTAMQEAFTARRRIMVDGLRAIDGVELPDPAGAFYVFPRFETDDDVALCTDLIDQAHVAGTPGSAFGAQGKGHIRFSYAASEDVLEEGLRRLQEFFA